MCLVNSFSVDGYFVDKEDYYLEVIADPDADRYITIFLSIVHFKTFNSFRKTLYNCLLQYFLNYLLYDLFSRPMRTKVLSTVYLIQCLF